MVSVICGSPPYKWITYLVEGQILVARSEMGSNLKHVFQLCPFLLDKSISHHFPIVQLRFLSLRCAKTHAPLAMLRRPSHFDSLSFTLQPVMEKMAVKFVAGTCPPRVGRDTLW